ncbi:MAG: hypothetical protein NT175_12680 [Bacteroidetes bacterium]|nr:hypothetical protein [Bacteroidota bacterium]
MNKAKKKLLKKSENKELSIKQRTGLNYLIIILFTLILYGNTAYNKFSLDDHNVTYINQTVQKGIKAIPEIFSTKYATEGELTYGYRPLSKVTYAIEYDIYGIKPAISHIINILLYAFTGLLLFTILKKLLSGYAAYFPLFITLVFLAHPVHTEVVASLKNREEILSFLFGLLMLNAIINYSRTNRNRQLVWGLLFFILGILSKPTIGIFLALIPLVLYFFTDISTKKILLLSSAILAVFLVVIILPRLFISENVRPMMFYENPLFFENSMWLRIGTGFLALLYYLRLLVFPHPLLFYYGYDMIPVVNPGNIWVMLSIIFHLAILIYAIYKIREKHILSFAILFYLISMAIYSNIVLPSPGIIAERYLLTASLGFSITLIWFIFKIFRVDPKVNEIPQNKLIPVIILVFLILIPYSVRTITRNKHWKNYLTLYERDIRYLDKSVKANVLYASALTVDLSGRFDAEGIQKDTTLIKKHYKRALELWPENYEVLNNLGSFYAYTLERYDSAIICFEQAIRYNPKIAEPYLNLAQSFRKARVYNKAIENFRKFLEIKPGNTYALTEMGSCYFEMGDLHNAIKANEELMRLAPASDLPYINIGNFYLQSSDTLTAIHYWEQAVEKVPQVKLCVNLSNFYRNKGDMNKARHYYELSLTAEKRK